MNRWFQAGDDLPRPRSVFALLGAVFLLRLVVVLLTRDDVIFRVPYLDAAFYHFWARSLASGGGDFVDAYFLGPLYPHFLGWLYRLGIDDVFAVRLLQTGLGGLDILLVLRLGWRLHAPSSGVIAALLLAFHGTLFFYEGFLVMESLLTTLVLAGCMLLLLPSPSRWWRMVQIICAALLLGAASAGRGTVLLLIPVALWILLAPRDREEQRSLRWGAVLALLLIWGVTLLPVVHHNAARGADWTLTTNAGVNFYAGNNPHSRGRFRPPPGVTFFTSVPQLPESDALPPAVARRRLTTEAVAGTPRAADSGYWMQQSLDWMRSAPGSAFLLFLRKAALVLQGREIGQIESPAFQQQRLPLLRLFWVGWSLLLPLAFLGLWVGWREGGATRRTVQQLAVLVGALLLPCVVFFVTARYRLVAAPFVCLLAGIGATCLLLMWRQERRRFWSWILVSMLVLVTTRLGARPPASAPGWESAQMAERYYATGDLKAAIDFQEKASKLLPRKREIQLNLALYWSERGEGDDVQRAENTLRLLAREYPRDVIVLFNWASLLSQSGNLQAARQVYERVLELDPGFEPARRNLKILHDHPEARKSSATSERHQQP